MLLKQRKLANFFTSFYTHICYIIYSNKYIYCINLRQSQLIEYCHICMYGYVNISLKNWVCCSFSFRNCACISWFIYGNLKTKTFAQGSSVNTHSLQFSRFYVDITLLQRQLYMNTNTTHSEIRSESSENWY